MRSSFALKTAGSPLLRLYRCISGNALSLHLPSKELVRPDPLSWVRLRIRFLPTPGPILDCARCTWNPPRLLHCICLAARVSFACCSKIVQNSLTTSASLAIGSSHSAYASSRVPGGSQGWKPSSATVSAHRCPFLEAPLSHQHNGVSMVDDRRVAPFDVPTASCVPASCASPSRSSERHPSVARPSLLRSVVTHKARTRLRPSHVVSSSS